MSAHYHAQSDEPGPGHTLPLLHQLVYCSRATEGVGDSAVERIIAIARRMNPEQGITGLLVFGSGVFFQWIEGPRDNVVQLMQRIQRDPRHERVVTLSQSEEVRERLFPDWSMELVTPDHIRDVLLDAMATAEDEKNAESLRLILEQLDSTDLGQLMGDA
jgi:hypothetical protein